MKALAMQGDLKFTILLPTRSRSDTLRYSLENLLSQDYANFQILVSDNFSDDDTMAVVDSFRDSRVRYLNTGRRISMSHNWEFALSAVSDGWITYVGDDDGLMPGCLRYVNDVVRETACSALTSKFVRYRWPTARVNGSIALAIPLSNGYEVRNSKEWLRRVMAGRARYFDLPWIYSGGFAALDAVKSALDPAGKFFCSMTPDVYSAVALAAVTDRYVAVNRPLALNGTSKNSTGLSCLGHTGNPTAANIFYSEPNISFYKGLGDGKIASLQFLTYESYLQAAHLHCNSLRVSDMKQFALALAESAGPVYESVEGYLAPLMRSRDLSLEVVKAKARRYRLIARAVVMARRLKDIFPLRYIEDGYGARNIFEAAIVSKAIYEECVGNRFWKFKWLLALFGRACRSIFRRAAS